MKTLQSYNFLFHFGCELNVCKHSARVHISDTWQNITTPIVLNSDWSRALQLMYSVGVLINFSIATTREQHEMWQNEHFYPFDLVRMSTSVERLATHAIASPCKYTQGPFIFYGMGWGGWRDFGGVQPHQKKNVCWGGGGAATKESKKEGGGLCEILR